MSYPQDTYSNSRRNVGGAPLGRTGNRGRSAASPLGSAAAIFAAAATLASFGCYSYQPPPRAASRDNFSSLSPEDKVGIPFASGVLSVEAAKEIAVRNNPDLISTRHAMGAAMARFHQSFSAFLPTIDGYYNIGMAERYPQYYSGPAAGAPRRSSTYTNELGMSGSITIFDGLVREMNMLAARADSRRSEESLADVHRLLAKGVSDTYNRILLARERIHIAEADLEFNNRLREESEIKFDAGAVALSDVLNFRIKATEAENTLIEQTYNMRAAKYALAALMGLTDGIIPDGVEFTPILEGGPVELADITVYFDTALANRADLRASRQSLEAAKYRMYSRWGALLPELSFNVDGGYRWQRAQYRSGATGTTYDNNRFLNYGLGAQWNLFQGGSRLARIRENQALVAQSEYQLEGAWLGIIAEVRDAYDEVTKSVQRLSLYEKIQEATTQNRELVQQEYNAGNADITRLNQAQRDLVAAQSNLVTARIDLDNARAALAAAIGDK